MIKYNNMSLKSKFPEVAQLRFGQAHSLFVGHKPKDVSCENGLCENILSEATPESIASFGLFGGNNNMNTFYPGISAEDWTPKDSDFIDPIFRVLSETIVSQYGVPIDFSMNGVLKASMPLLLGQTVNTNHETETENAIGSVSKVFWQEATKVGNVKVPAGINGVFKIDAKSNPRIARGILMDPPSIHSNSVTVQFKHEPSHPELRDEFWDKVGTYDKDGNLIRLIVTKIVAYKETSLVSHGADVFAQKINKDGNIINPKYSGAVYNFKEQSFNINPHKKSDMELKELLARLGLSDSGIEDWEGLIAHFTTDSGVAPEIASYRALLEVDKDLTPESLTALMANQIPKGAVLLEEGQAIITEEQSTVLNRVTELGGLEAVNTQVELGNTYLSHIRDNAIANYRLIAGDSADDNIIATIQKADLTAAKSFEAHYAAEVEKDIPLTCKDCGSQNIDRTSHRKESSSGNKKIDTNSYEEYRDKVAARARRKASAIHKKD